MIWAAIHPYEKAIWFVVPKVEGKRGMDAEQYIEIMQKFRAELAERDIDSTKIVYQQGFYTYHREFTINPLSFQTFFHPLLSSENCHHHKVINITLSPTPLSPLTMFLKRYYRWCSMSQISQSPGIFSNVAPRRKLYNTTNGQIY